MKQSKRLRSYLDRVYDLTVVRIEDEEQVLYKAFSRDLDPLTFYGVGATREKAIESFEETKRELFGYFLKNNLAIPEPTREDASLPSGKFVFRTTPVLHAKLVELARRQGQSLNQYVNSILQSYATMELLLKQAEQRMESLVSNCESQLQTMHEIQWGFHQPRPYEVKDYNKVG